MNQEDSLKQYLECEALLSEFFVKSKFCYDDCTSKLISRYPTQQPGNIGCCHNNFYISTDKETKFLDEERERIYGKEKKDNPVLNEMKKVCDYHSDKGCLTPTHKSPKCVAFICSDYEKHLFEKFKIDYNFKEFKKQLIEVLSGELSQEEINIFKNEIKDSIKIVSS